jgi:serine/threonine-protein kinase
VSEPAPARLGKYELVRELGAGAMGVVYLAYDAAIDRKVAVKTIRKDAFDAATAAAAAARFRQEAMAAGRLTHPGIVAVYDYGEDENVAYIVMEYAPGQELGYYAAGKTLPLPEIGALMGQLLDALEYAHQAGVVHRDIKPSNILLSTRLKITDFGIARIATSQLTHTGTVMGTPAYMAPEQYRGVGVDHRVDLFASAAVFHELLTGQPAFSGESIGEIAYKVCHVEAQSATSLRPGLPRAVDAVLTRALAKDKDARFSTARELSAAIDAAIAGREPPPAAAAPGAFAVAATTFDATGQATGTSTPRGSTSVTPEAITRITQTLAKYVGPIAKVMVKKTGSEARTYRDLCVSLSARLPPEERSRFLKELGLE